MERTSDEIAQGELRELGLDHEIVIESLVKKVAALLA
jgi:hypothetical protein